jgi:hypothetical protein
MTVIELYDGAGNRAAAQTEAAHIYDGLTTTLTRGFTSADFAACPPVITGTTLAARLDAALTSPSGSYTIVLDGTEGDLAAFEPKTLNVTDGKNITITIRGGGNEIQVDRTGTPLFTLGADAGSSLGLTVQDLTLRGRIDNSVPVVGIEERGILLMKAGSLITGNTYTYGGGVRVNGGTFTMNGGAVSENTTPQSSGSRSGGGGVLVNDGTFTMNGGAVSGNTSFSFGGGGVRVNDGTFTMNGGAVSGNTSNVGGGVCVSYDGTFTMSGGTVSGNTAFSTGGGVSVYYDGTFTMNGGAVSGNTSSSGGGVYLSSGTFTKQSGGVIYGSNESNSSLRNTASGNYGHAVYVSSARRRNTTAGMGVTLDSTKSGAEGGWEE